MYRKLSLVVVLVAACSAEPGPDGPAGVIGSAISDSLRDSYFGFVSPHERVLEHDLFEPVSAELLGEVDAVTCRDMRWQLEEACYQITSSGAYAYCTPQTSFFYANKIPRCAARVTVHVDPEDLMPITWAFDFSGEPYEGPAPSCGNGELEPGEQCDDGNNEEWDGCDPNCLWEEFNGCEAVIEYHFKIQEIAVVDQELWSGPRSHLMVNTAAVPLRGVTPQTCNDAVAAGADVCNELSQTMPFVGWCSPQIEYFEDEFGPACAVQLQVGFQSIDPDSGVYTLDLPGILAFTIR